MKLLTVTWSYEDEFDYSSSLIYRSFVKHNDKNDFVNIHFNRKLYADLENEFKSKYEYQHEYILYKIFILAEKINKIEGDHFVYCDTNDVVCLGNINELQFDCLKGKVMFSSELHKYPPQSKWNNYPEENESKKLFLNSGLFFGSKYDILELLLYCIKKILPLEYKDFGGDQGIYTYEFINNNDSKIILDDCRFFLNTYLRSADHFELKFNRLFFKDSEKSPLFVHDNGWNYGSPRFIEKFNMKYL